ncbi:MAG: 30S ribosomal protein S2 [Deltaproteobacteria bacterium]|nr:30S ribosomal protein S2 [Deltaproteobacteria bacterium]NIS78600.1 30S ribosomal protein S2 [Deltaproteobacteria bacterium]
MQEKTQPKITMKQLLEAGVHFGHQTRRWNPKMESFIFTARNGIHIIDLQQTVKMFDAAYEYIRDITAQGKTVLFVGTKKQAQESVKEEAERCGMPYVHQRWLGGMLTNFQTIKGSIEMLDRLEEMEEDGTFEKLTKKEVLGHRKKRDKLLKVLGGVRSMKRPPDAFFVVDPLREEIAVREARKLEIPVAAIVDTNCDPDMIDIIIPGNDDAIRAIKLFLRVVADAVIEGRAEYEAQQAGLAAEEDVEEPTISLIDTEGEDEGEPGEGREGVALEADDTGATVEVAAEEEKAGQAEIEEPDGSPAAESEKSE